MRKFFYNLATDQYPLIFTFPLKIILWIFSLVYLTALWLNHLGFKLGVLRSHKLPKPVISVGNLTWGGAGKTPFTIFLAEHLKSSHAKTAILSRGYGGSGNDNDEVKMMKEYLKDVSVVVGAKRYEAGKAFLKNHSVDMFLLDDGFQHRALQRDLNIVLVDATNPWGNGCLLPCGILREPKSVLRRADIIVLTKVDLAKESLEKLASEIKALCPATPIFQAIHRPDKFHDLLKNTDEPLEFLADQRVNALCSIAQPAAFQATLEKIKLSVHERFNFLDHEEYSAGDLKNLITKTRAEGISTIITTAKDKVKLEKYFQEFINQKIKLVSLEIKIEIIHGREELVQRINRLF